MELELDVIVVLIVFIGFCIGSALLVRTANSEMKKQETEEYKTVENTQNKKQLK